MASDEQGAANDAMEMAAEIQAYQNFGTSLFECVLDPPEKVLNQMDYRSKDINNWTTQSDSYMVHYWTSAPLVESPMFKLKQAIQIHGGPNLFIQDKIESCLIFQLRFGTETDIYNIHYNRTQTWARDLPVRTAEHSFKKLLRFLDPQSVQGTATGIFQRISK
eukprot:5683657-Pyramimonas_sp.AAC.1